VTIASLKRGAFDLEAESRPSKQARALSADRDIRNAAAVNIDKDPTTPPGVAILDEGDNYKNRGFNEAAPAASPDIPTLYEGNGHREPEY
jgi:hypothetical protein